MTSTINRQSSSTNSQLLVDNKPILSIKEARKILAEEGAELSDVEIYELLQHMGELASYGLEMAQVRKSAVV